MQITRFFSRNWHRVTIVFLLIVAFCLRIYNLGGDLYFDEGATWLISKGSTILEIILGKYSIEGSPPLAYLLLKPFLQVVREEAHLRFISVIFGIASLIVIYKTFQFGNKKWITLLAFLLVCLNPVHVQYSREFRFYSIGFFLQACSMYYFYCYLLERHNLHWIHLSFAFLCIGVFTTFSSLCLIGIYFVTLLTRNRHSAYKRQALFLLGLISLTIASWILLFFLQGGGVEALHYYSGYRNREIVQQTWYTLHGLFFLWRDWGVMDPNFPFDHFISPVAKVIGYTLLPLTFIYSILILFVAKPSKVMWKPRQLIFSNCSPKEVELLKLHAIGFLASFFGSALFSLLFFNIMSPKLLFPMLISGIWLSIYALKTTISFLFPKRIFLFTFGSVFFLVALLSGWTSFRNSMLPKYSVQHFIKAISDGNHNTTCARLIISQGAAIGVVKYYEYLQGTPFLSTIQVIPVNFTSSENLKQTASVFTSLRAQTDRCDTVYYLKYYDFWPRTDPSYVEFNSWLSKYTLQSKQVVDQFLSFEIYSK